MATESTGYLPFLKKAVKFCWNVMNLLLLKNPEKEGDLKVNTPVSGYTQWQARLGSLPRLQR